MSHLRNVDVVCTNAGSSNCTKLIKERKCPHIINAKLLSIVNLATCVRALKAILAKQPSKGSGYLLVNTDKTLFYQTNNFSSETLKLFPAYLTLKILHRNDK